MSLDGTPNINFEQNTFHDKKDESKRDKGYSVCITKLNGLDDL